MIKTMKISYSTWFTKEINLPFSKKKQDVERRIPMNRNKNDIIKILARK